MSTLLIVRHTTIGFYVVRRHSAGEIVANCETTIEGKRSQYWCETDCARPNHCRVFTPDGGVINCSTPADADRVCRLLNGEN